jgi:hypothetical protein
VGQTITYTYWVTNSGLGALVGVVARDDKLGFVGLDSTTLAPHAVASGTLTHTVQVRDLPGPLTNTVTASGTAAVGPPLLARATDWALVQLKPGVNNYLPIIFKSAP